MKRQFLVYLVPSGDSDSPLLRVLHKPRNFDLAVRFYKEPGSNVALVKEAEYVMTGGLSKFHAASLFFEECGLSDAYDGYLFLDGDLQFDPTMLSRFLSLVHAAGFNLAQPSVSRDSYCYWKMAYHQPGFAFRETSFVEVMAPYLSRSALRVARPTFTRSISTYGLDLVWPSLVGHNGIAVVDAFQVRHPDRVDHTSGSFYKYLKSIGVDLDEEERLILADYGIAPERAYSRRGYFFKRKWFGSQQSRKLVSVPLDAPEKKTEKQVFIDFLMWRARTGPARDESGLAAQIAPFLK